MKSLRQWVFCFGFCCAVVGVGVASFGNETVTLPLVVNIQGFGADDPEDSEDPIDQIKGHFEKQLEDANSMLGELGLRLGPVTYQVIPGGATEVQQGTDGARTLKTEGRRELEEETGNPNKGQKIYVIETVMKANGDEIPGLGACPGPVIFLSLFAAVMPRVDVDMANETTTKIHRNGNIFVHELLHNAGRCDHEDGTVMDEETFFNDIARAERDGHRTITGAQRQALTTYFGQRGTAQCAGSSFAPQEPSSHYAFASNDVGDAGLGWMQLALGQDEHLVGDLAWNGMFSTTSTANFDLYLDLDNDPDTGQSTPLLEGVDQMLQIAAVGDGTSVQLEGNFISEDDPSEPGEDPYKFNTLNLITQYDTSADGGSVASRNVIHFRVPAMVAQNAQAGGRGVLMVEDGQEQQTVFFTFIQTPPTPQIIGVPRTIQPGAVFEVDGRDFSRNAQLDVWLTQGDGVSRTPLDPVQATANGRFSTSINTNTLSPGSYFIHFQDLNGRYAFGAFEVSGTGGGSTSVEQALDINQNNRLDDDEILRAIQFWVLGQVVPGTDQTISDTRMLALITIWITGQGLE